MSNNTRREKSRRRKEDTLYLLALAFLLSLLYCPQFFAGLTAMDRPELMDVTSQWFPGYTATARMYQEGTFPLWNSHLYAGMPWAAYSHTGAFYPLNILLFTTLSFFDAVTLAHLCHALLAGLGLYLFARSLRLSPPAAFLAGLVFPCSGFFYYLQSQLSHHASAAWTPLLLLGIHRLRETRRLSYLLGTAAVVALMNLAGDIEGVVYTLIFAALLLLFDLRRETAERPQPWVSAGGALVSGLFLSMALLLPLFELVGFSVRSSRSAFDLEFSSLFRAWWFYLSFAFSPFASFAKLHPGAAYNHGLPPFYVGILPLAGALFSLFLFRRERRVQSLLSAAIILTVFLSLKQIDFFAPLMKRVPIVGRLATPERALELAQLAAIICASIVFDYIRNNLQIHRLRQGALILFILAAATALLAPRLVSPPSRFLLAAAFGAGGAILLAGAPRFLLRPAFTQLLLALLVIVDVYGLALVSAPRTSPDDFQLPDRIGQFLASQDLTWRHIAFQKIDPEEKAPLLSGLITAHLGADSPLGHMRLPLARYFEFLHLLDPQVVKDWNQVFFGVSTTQKIFYTANLYLPGFLSDQNLHLLNLLALRFVFSPNFPVKFASPFSLMNPSDQTLLSDQSPGESRFLRDHGRPARRAQLPVIFTFDSYIHKDMHLAFELRLPPSPEEEPDSNHHEKEDWPAGLAALLSACPAEDPSPAAPCALWTRSLPPPEGPELEVRFPLEEVSGRLNRFQLRLEAKGEEETKMTVIDLRLLRPDAPFQRAAAGEVDIFINRHALPRAFIVREAEALSAQEMKERMPRGDAFDPWQRVLLEKGVVSENLILLTQGTTMPGKAKILSHHHQEVKVMTMVPKPAWLVLSDVYHPGWRVFVDGRERRIYRGNYVFRTVFLPEDSQEVIFQYQPVCFRLGLWFSLTSAASLLLLASRFLLSALRPRRKAVSAAA